MTVLLVILMFAAFVALDYLVGARREARQAVRLARSTAAALPAPEPVWVAGYQLPEALHYHQGHTWARVLDPTTVLVGMDDFARKLIGPATRVRLPATGVWVRQGEKGMRIHTDGRAADLISPVEGEVVEVNRRLREQPELAVDDPYGRGWMMKVRVGDMSANFRNLMSGSLARRWIQDASEALEVRLMALSGSVLQDGGARVEDYARHLEAEDWKRLVGEFLLT
jgi:glycine cleavage system H lipoate-binding protein